MLFGTQLGRMPVELHPSTTPNSGSFPLRSTGRALGPTDQAAAVGAAGP